MTMILEPAKEIPVVHECDVCVIGGSATGVFAAVRAAELGMDVAMVEATALFGGMATAAMVNIWHSLHNTTYDKQIIAGLTASTMKSLQDRGAADYRPNNPNSAYTFRPAELAIELDQLIMTHKIRPFLHTRFCATVKDDDTLTAAIIEDKSGRRAIKARFFIDATGDGDVIHRSALPTRQPTHLQPPTQCAFVRGVDQLRERNEGFDFAGAVFNPKYPEALRLGFLWSAKVPGTQDVRMTAGTRVHGAICCDADSLTQAEIEGRRQVRSMVDVLRNHFEGGDEVFLLALGAHIGVRETRHAVCQYQLTEEDVLHGRKFEDAIGYGSYRVDVHHMNGGGITFRYQDGREDIVVPGQATQHSRWREEQDVDPTYYEIPLRCLVPQGSSNLLAAGRMIDADEGAYGALRVMVNCNQMGEAAGTAAALALRHNWTCSTLDPAVIRRTMAETGSIII